MCMLWKHCAAWIIYFFFEKLDHHYFNHYHLLFLSYIIWECAIKFLQQNLRPMRLQKYESMLWPKKGAHIFLCDLLFGPSINYGLYLTNLFKLVTFINLMKSSYYVHICIYFNRCITNYKALILLEGVLSAQCKKG